MKKYLLGIILGAVIFGSIGVYAATKYKAIQIEYKNTTVENALNALYNNQTKCPNGYVCGWQPKYFEFGTPTTSSATDYTILRKTVFAALDTKGNKGLCIIRNNNLLCFKADDYENQKIYIKQVLSDVSCTPVGSDVRCIAGNFDCSINVTGSISCSDTSATKYCVVSSNGNVDCNSW